jgi:IS30 family transposase
MAVWRRGKPDALMHHSDRDSQGRSTGRCNSQKMEVVMTSYGRASDRCTRFVGDAVLISDRPAEIADRAIPGHWEGDVILGSSAIGTLVERSTRFAMLLHLPRMDGYQQRPNIKNGPALAGHGAEAVRKAIVRSMGRLPEQLRQLLTWDQGAEMAQT